MPAQQDPTVELLRRLDELEGEMTVLRSRLSHGEAAAHIPDGEFGVLVFEVDGTGYGIPIAQVVEIVRYVRLTAVADVPPAIAGAINVRGEVMPVVDGQFRLAHRPTRPNLRTSIILVQSGARRFGLIVSAVNSVDVIDGSQVRAPNSDVTRFSCVSGVVTRSARVVQLLDTAKLLSVHQWQSVSERMEREAQRSSDGERSEL